MSGVLQQIHLVPCEATILSFADVSFELRSQGQGIRIAGDGADFAEVHPENHSVPSESSVADGIISAGSRHGAIPYERYFLVDWEDHVAHPQVTFTVPPARVIRRFAEHGALELGLEDVTRYRVTYDDGVEAVIDRVGPASYRIVFSTGLTGAFWKDADGSYTMRFRGDRLGPSEEASRSQSKFIVSRCKYSGNLLLLLQEPASVALE